MKRLGVNAIASKRLFASSSSLPTQRLAVVSHPLMLEHDVPYHPECPERISSIMKGFQYSLKNEQFFADNDSNSINNSNENIDIIMNPSITYPSENESELLKNLTNLIKPAHPSIDHITNVLSKASDCYKNNSSYMVDGDTTITRGTYHAMIQAISCVVYCVDLIYNHDSNNSNNNNNNCNSNCNYNRCFACVRPPGHHAESGRSMGFCFFNNVLIGAFHALSKYSNFCDKIAIIDFDVHHGNGSQEIAWNCENILYCSTHQSPFYPGTGSHPDIETGNFDNICNVPLLMGSDTKEFQNAYTNIILPKIDKFKPDLIMISAGFDAHKNDPLANLNLVESDYAWITKELVNLSNQHCNGKIISALEGGYDLQALSNSVLAHCKELTM